MIQLPPIMTTVVRPFLLHLAIVAAAVWLAGKLPAHVPAGFVNPAYSPASPLLDPFIRWDAHWYTYVAAHGYSERSVVFFPVLVLLIRLLAGLGLDHAAAGVLLGNLFALTSFIAMAAAFRKDFPARQAERALLAYAVMPTSFFLNSVYTEPIFLTFALSSIYLVRCRHWWLAGFFAALAALTRNLGVFLFFFAAWEYWLEHRRQKGLSWAILSLALAPAAFIGFMIYNELLLGNPVAFMTSQQSWGREFGWPWDNFLRNLRLMPFIMPNTQAGIALDTFLVLLGLAGLVTATFSRRYPIPPSYLAVAWLWFLIPLFSTSSFLPLYSMSRFLLVVFPIYLVIAQMPADLYYGFIIVNALLLFVCTILFVNWYWVG